MTDRPAAPNVLAITFLYYKDLPRAFVFYRDVMGFPLAIDQGDLAKIVRIAPNAHLGLVDEARGINRWQAEKCVQICIRVEDLEGWHAYLAGHEVDDLSQIFTNDRIGIRAFVLRDPEGYQIEIQQSTRPDA